MIEDREVKPSMAAESVTQPPLLLVKVEPGSTVVPPEIAPTGTEQQETPISDNPPTVICKNDQEQQLVNHVVDVSNSVSQLCSLAAVLSDFQRCYEDLQGHIDSIRTSIDAQLHKTLGPECHRLNSPQPLAIAASDGTQLQEPKKTAIADPGLTEIESIREPPPLAIVSSSNETQPSERTETKIGRRAQSEVEALCRSSNGRGLRKYVVTHFSDIPKLRAEIPAAMKLARSPARLVFDSCGKFFRQRRKAYTGDNPTTMKEVQAIVLILESFLLMGDDGDGNKIAWCLQKEAVSVAMEWMKQLEDEGGVADAVELDARALLLFIACFGIRVKYEDIRSLIRRSNAMEICGALRNSGFLLAKIPEMIHWMTKRNKELEAVNIVLIFGLENKFPPHTILTSFLKKTNETWGQSRAAAQGSDAELIKADQKKLADLKGVLECLENHNMDPAKVLPEWKINENISRLEKCTPSFDDTLEKKQQVDPKQKADEAKVSEKFKQTPEGGLTAPMTSNGRQLPTTPTHASGNSCRDGLMITSSLTGAVPGHVNGNVQPLPSTSYAVESSNEAVMIRSNSVNGESPLRMNSFPASSPAAPLAHSAIDDNDYKPYRLHGEAVAREEWSASCVYTEPSEALRLNGMSRASKPASSPASSQGLLNSPSSGALERKSSDMDPVKVLPERKINEDISSLEKGTPKFGKMLEKQQQVEPKRKAEDVKFSEKLKQTRFAGDATRTPKGGPTAPMTSNGCQRPTTPTHAIENSCRDGLMTTSSLTGVVPGHMNGNVRPLPSTSYAVESSNGVGMVRLNSVNGESPLHMNSFPASSSAAPSLRTGAGSPAGSYAGGIHSAVVDRTGQISNNGSHQIGENMSSLEKGSPNFGKTLEKQQQAEPKRKADEAKFSEKLKQTRVAGDATRTPKGGSTAPTTSRQLPKAPTHANGGLTAPMASNGRQLPTAPTHANGGLTAPMNSNGRKLPTTPTHGNGGLTAPMNSNGRQLPTTPTRANGGLSAPMNSNGHQLPTIPAHTNGGLSAPMNSNGRQRPTTPAHANGGLSASMASNGRQLPTTPTHAIGGHSFQHGHVNGNVRPLPSTSYAVENSYGGGAGVIRTNSVNGESPLHKNSIPWTGAGGSPAGSHAAGFHSATVDRTGQISNNDSHQYRSHGEAAAREDRSAAASRVYPEPSEALGLNGLSGASKPAPSLANFPGLLNSSSSGASEQKPSDLYHFADAVL